MSSTSTVSTAGTGVGCHGRFFAHMPCSLDTLLPRCLASIRKGSAVESSLACQVIGKQPSWQGGLCNPPGRGEPRGPGLNGSALLATHAGLLVLTMAQADER